jgi:hypothetical protein
MVRSLAFAALLALAGCAGAGVPDEPGSQPGGGARLSAGYQVVGDRLRFQIDTDGRRLEEAVITRPDGTEVRPRTVEHPGTGYAGGPVGVGIGVGGGSWGGRGGVGVGTGVSVGIPVGGGRVEGPTIADFSRDEAGPPPWRLHVKLAGVPPMAIVVGDGPESTPR